MLGVAGLHQEGHQEKGRRKRGRPCLGWQDCIKRDIRRREEGREEDHAWGGRIASRGTSGEGKKEERKTMLGVAGLHQEGHQEKGRRKRGRPCLGWQDCIKRDIRRREEGREEDHGWGGRIASRGTSGEGKKEERKTMLGVAGLHQEGQLKSWRSRIGEWWSGIKDGGGGSSAGQPKCVPTLTSESENFEGEKRYNLSVLH